MSLALQISLEHRVVLTSESLDGNGALLAKVIRCSLGEWPLDQGLGGYDLVGSGFAHVVCLGHDWIREVDLDVGISPLWLKKGLEFFLINPNVSAFLCLLDGRWASLEEHALRDGVGTRLLQV